MRIRNKNKGKRDAEDEIDDEEDEDESQETEQIGYSDAQKLLDEIVARPPTQERVKELITKCFSEAGRAWEDRENVNASIRKAKARLSRAEAEWMAEEGITEQMNLRQQRKMERKTRGIRREIEDLEDDFIACNIKYVQWARLCDLFRMQIDADTAALGKL
jgi:hypothetical protein